MKYLFEPRRLYIKQCPCCGLKYFGMTSKNNIEKYFGSGKYWTDHLNKHGVKPIHLWNSDWFYTIEKLNKFARLFSSLNKIVESKEWANLIPEDGYVKNISVKFGMPAGGNHYKAKAIKFRGIDFSCKKDACSYFNISLRDLNKELNGNPTNKVGSREYSEEIRKRQFENNSMAKPFIFRNKKFASISAAERYFGLSRYIMKKEIENNIS